MPLKTDPDSLGFLLNDTSRLMRQSFERRIANIGLQITPGEARALIYIAANEGARQSVIADRMGVEPMTVCGYIDRLEKCGLVGRQPDTADRRAKNVHTTEAAEAMITAIRAEAKIIVEQAQAGLDAGTAVGAGDRHVVRQVAERDRLAVLRHPARDLAAPGRQQDRGGGGAPGVEHETLAAPAPGSQDGRGVGLHQRERRAQRLIENLRPRPALGRVPQVEQQIDRLVLPRSHT